MGEHSMDDRAWAAAFGGNDSWYWCPERKSYVLIADDETTPKMLGEQIRYGDPISQAEIDFWAMAAAVVSDNAVRSMSSSGRREG